MSVMCELAPLKGRWMCLQLKVNNCRWSANMKEKAHSLPATRTRLQRRDTPQRIIIRQHVCIQLWLITILHISLQSSFLKSATPPSILYNKNWTDAMFDSSSWRPAGVSLRLRLEGGGRGRRGAARLDVLQVAGVAEKMAVQRVAAVTLLVVQLHLTVLDVEKQRCCWVSQHFVFRGIWTKTTFLNSLSPLLT